MPLDSWVERSSSSSSSMFWMSDECLMNVWSRWFLVSDTRSVLLESPDWSLPWERLLLALPWVRPPATWAELGPSCVATIIRIILRGSGEDFMGLRGLECVNCWWVSPPLLQKEGCDQKDGACSPLNPARLEFTPKSSKIPDQKS